MVNQEALNEVFENLSLIEEDSAVPKNVREKIKSTKDILLNEEDNIDLKIDKSLSELSEVAEDPNLPAYVRMQIWSIVSQLESR